MVGYSLFDGGLYAPVPRAPTQLPVEKKRGRVLRAETHITSGIWDTPHSFTCIAARFDLPEGERVLPFKCSGLKTVDHFLVQEGDDVFLTAESFSKGTTIATALSIIWPQGVLSQDPDEVVTETGIITRMAKPVIAADRTTCKTMVTAAALLTDALEREHPVVFVGAPSDHVQLGLIAAGTMVRVTYRPLGPKYGAQVSLIKLDIDWNQAVQTAEHR